LDSFLICLLLNKLNIFQSEALSRRINGIVCDLRHFCTVLLTKSKFSSYDSIIPDTFSGGRNYPDTEMQYEHGKTFSKGQDRILQRSGIKIPYSCFIQFLEPRPSPLDGIFDGRWILCFSCHRYNFFNSIILSRTCSLRVSIVRSLNDA